MEIIKPHRLSTKFYVSVIIFVDDMSSDRFVFKCFFFNFEKFTFKFKDGVDLCAR